MGKEKVVRDYSTLLKEYRGRIKKLSDCLKVTALINSELNYSSLLKNIMHIAQVSIDAEGCSLLLYDDERENLYFQVAESKGAGRILRGKPVKKGVGIAGTVAASGKSMLIEDAYSNPLFSADYDKSTGFKTKTILAIPLKFRKEVIGVTMLVNKKDGSSFTAEDQFILEAISHSASVAIENARLHEDALQQQKIHQDLEFAQSVQQSFMPQKILSTKEFVLEGRNQPAMSISGDFFDYFHLSDNEVAFILGDVSGKGVSAALFGARVISDFRFLAAKHKAPEVFCSSLNTLLKERSQRGMFATLVYGVIQLDISEITMVNAGHLSPILYRKFLGDYISFDEHHAIPLGILDDVAFQPVTFRLNYGDTLLLFTDGMTECRNKQKQELGFDNFVKAILNTPKKADLIPAIFNGIKSYSLQHDDMTVLTIRNEGKTTGNVRVQQKEFLSKPENSKNIRSFVRTYLKNKKIDDALIHQVVLSVDEACSNVIKYSYGMQEDGKILIKHYSYNNEYVISITDYGKKPDLTTIKSRDLDDIKPGGLGTHFINSYMDSVQFNLSVEGQNNLTLKKIWR